MSQLAKTLEFTFETLCLAIHLFDSYIFYNDEKFTHLKQTNLELEFKLKNFILNEGAIIRIPTYI